MPLILPEQNCLEDPIEATIRPVLRAGLEVVDPCLTVVGSIASINDEAVSTGGPYRDIYTNVVIDTDDRGRIVAIVPPLYAANGGRAVLANEWGIAVGMRVAATGALTNDAGRGGTVLLPTWEIVPI